MAVLEVLNKGRQSFFELDRDRVRIGRSSGNDLVLSDDTTVSREHAVLECFGSRWLIRDLDSANGTDVNGTRLIAGSQRALSNDDEVIIGRTRLVFHDRNVVTDDSTSKRSPRPKVTDKEKEVLIELCRPLLSGDGAFRAPTPVKDIAKRMYVTEAAVKAHLSRLYDKFEVYEHGPDRRRELANRAIETGTVTRRDLEDRDDGDDTDS